MDVKNNRPNILTPILLVIAAVLGTASGFIFLPKEGEIVSEIPSSLATTMVIASILFFVAVWIVIHKALKDKKASFSILLGLVAWYGIVYFLGTLGFFGQRPLFVPNIIWAFVVLFIFIKLLLSSTKLQQLFDSIPLQWIVNLQLFRVMGVGFLSLYMMRLLPGQFAIPTGWGDVFVGITAPIVAYIYLLKKSYSKKLAVLWNWIGIADLTMSISLGILTYPEPLQVVPTQLSNGPIALFPLVLVPCFAVPLSVILHLFSLRVLKKTN